MGRPIAGTPTAIPTIALCQSVQLAKVCDQCFEIILLQIDGCHTRRRSSYVGRTKQRNQLRFGIFLANARQRTCGGGAYASVSMAGAARLSLKESLSLQHLWVGRNQRSRYTACSRFRNEGLLHEGLRILILLAHLRRHPRITIIVPIAGYAKRRISNQEEKERAH